MNTYTIVAAGILAGGAFPLLTWSQCKTPREFGMDAMPLLTRHFYQAIKTWHQRGIEGHQASQ